MLRGVTLENLARQELRTCSRICTSGNYWDQPRRLGILGGVSRGIRTIDRIHWGGGGGELIVRTIDWIHWEGLAGELVVGTIDWIHWEGFAAELVVRTIDRIHWEGC